MKEGRVENASLMILEIFQMAFLDRFFPKEMREAKVDKYELKVGLYFGEGIMAQFFSAS